MRSIEGHRVDKRKASPGETVGALAPGAVLCRCLYVADGGDEFLLYLNPSLLGDAAQGMVNLAEMASLDQRVALKIRSVDRIGEDLRIVARIA